MDRSRNGLTMRPPAAQYGAYKPILFARPVLASAHLESRTGASAGHTEITDSSQKGQYRCASFCAAAAAANFLPLTFLCAACDCCPRGSNDAINGRSRGEISISESPRD